MSKSLESPRVVALMMAACVAVASAAGAADSARWYVVAKAGQSGVDERYGSPGLGGWGVDGDETSGAVEVGYSFHENLALQGGYHYLGKYTGFSTARPCVGICPLNSQVHPTVVIVPDNPSEARFDGFSLSLVPRWKASERFAVRGKVGVLDWDADLTFPFGEQSVFRPSGEELLAGAGLEYSLPRGAGLLVEYEHAGQFDVLSLGGTWRF